MATYTKITGTGLPTIYPTGYTETHYNDCRVREIDEMKETRVETDKPYQYYNDNNLLVRKAQLQLYKKYSIILFLQENNKFQYLFNAEDVRVYLTNGDIHFANFISADTELIADTGMKKIVVEYYDTNPSNYYEYQTVNYLNSGTIADEVTDGAVATTFDRLSVDGTAYYSKLKSFKISSDIIRKETEVAGVKKDSIRYDLTGYEIKLFFSSAELQLFLSDARSTDYGSLLYLAAGDAASTKYAIEFPEIEVNDMGGADIYSATIKFYNVKNTKIPY